MQSGLKRFTVWMFLLGLIAAPAAFAAQDVPAWMRGDSSAPAAPQNDEAVEDSEATDKTDTAATDSAVAPASQDAAPAAPVASTAYAAQEVPAWMRGDSSAPAAPQNDEVAGKADTTTPEYDKAPAKSVEPVAKRVEPARKNATAAASQGPDAPIQINGDSVEYFYEKEQAVGKGNVRIDYAGWQLSADEVTVNLKTKEAAARGNVVLTQEGAIYKGEEVLVNFGNKSAQVSHLKAALAPHYFARGETVRKVNDDYYMMENGYVTTCDDTQCDAQDVPFYRIQAKEIVYYPEDRIVIKHAVMRVGQVPIFYIPFMVIPYVDLQRFPVEVQMGKTPEWGFFALTRYRYYVNPDAKGSVLYDYRENQKHAGGVEHYYDTKVAGQGAVRAYYADDRCGEYDSDCARGKSGHLVDETDRYRAQLRHRWQMYPDTAMNLEMNKLSDEFVIQDFFAREEFERIAFPDNYLSVIHAKDDYTLSALGRWRFDDFLGVVERTPEVRFDTHTHAFEDTPFYWRQEAVASQLTRRLKNIETDQGEAVRSDLRHTLSYVQRIGDWTVTPFVGSRETYYSRNSDGSAHDFMRWNLESGADASTKYFKTYDFSTDAFAFDVNQLRHVVSPAIRYRYQSMPNHDRDTLIPFDAVDTLDEENNIRFELENKLQTKSHAIYREPNSELVKRDFIRTLTFAEMRTPQSDYAQLERIFMDVEFNPYNWLTFSGNTTYETETDSFAVANVDMVWHTDPLWVGFGQRFVQDGSNQTTAQVDWKINDIWALRVYERYELETDITDEFEASLERRNFFCWTIKLTTNYRDGWSYFVSFSPSAFAETTFRPTQTYRPIDPFIPTSGVMPTQDR